MFTFVVKETESLLVAWLRIWLLFDEDSGLKEEKNEEMVVNFLTVGTAVMLSTVQVAEEPKP